MRWVVRLSPQQHATVSQAVRSAIEAMEPIVDRPALDVLNVIAGRLRCGSEVELSLSDVVALQVCLTHWRATTVPHVAARNHPWDQWHWTGYAIERLADLARRYSEDDIVTSIARLDGLPDGFIELRL